MEKLISLGKINIKKVNTKFSRHYYDKRTSGDDIIQEKPLDGDRKTLTNVNAIWSKKDGTELTTSSPKIRVNAVYNENIIGYLIAQANTFELPVAMTILTRNTAYGGNGFHIRKDNIEGILPMFAAGWYTSYVSDWINKGSVYRSADGHEKFFKKLNDKNDAKFNKWLNRIMFYTGLEYFNKIRSFDGSDNRRYFNELSLDNNIDRSSFKDEDMVSLGNKTVLTKYLEDNFFFDDLNKEEEDLLNLWNELLEEVKKVSEYNDRYNYGIFQIEQEINIKDKGVVKYPEIDKILKEIRVKMKDYYLKYIKDMLIEYEFIK